VSRRIAVLLVLLATSACASASQNTAARVPATSPSAPSAVSHEHAMIGDATGDSGEGGGKEETDRLVIKNNRFIPQPFAVAQDYGLIIVNEDDVTHNVTIIGPGTPLSVNIGPGKTYDSIEQLHRPAGHYVMYDKLHPELRGTMAVSLRMMIVERRGY
jgi:plastocyanin